jgi:hypothetical protein
MVMAFIQYNANPNNNETIDCVIRGLSKVLDISWDAMHIILFFKAHTDKDVYLVNDVWIDLLKDLGFDMYYVPNTCPDCITVRRFCKQHPKGRYLLGTGSHVIAIVNGDYYDTWDSGDELPLYYFIRKE